MRHGLSQEETARRASITVRTLRRWERGEVWPSPTQVHTLCFVLDARAEEMMALSSGPLSPVPEPAIVPLDELQERAHALHFYARYWHEGALKELSFLRMEAQAWPQVARSGTGWEVLAELYSYHAYHLSCYDRFAESGIIADRALGLLNRGATPTKSQVLAAITAAHAAVQRGARPMPQRGREMLRPWLDAIDWPEYAAWLHSDMATYTAQCGDIESALRLAERARVIGATCGNRHELYNRELDEVQLLLSAGMPGRALNLIQKDRVNAARHQIAKFLLLESEAYLALAQPSSAQDRLQDALPLIEGGALVHLRERVDELMLQL
jgi:transcriptional regulator with XRE-family HTH domain